MLLHRALHQDFTMTSATVPLPNKLNDSLSRENVRNSNFVEPIRDPKKIAQPKNLLRGNYGTHTLRKTWGYHARKNGVELALIMHKLNHNSLAYTKRYLGITDDELEAVMRNLNL
jgi:site-specific recombinase XerD